MDSMKEKYEKPVIETENFVVEMMQAKCTISPGDVLYLATHVAYPSYDCDCKGTSENLS